MSRDLADALWLIFAFVVVVAMGHKVAGFVRAAARSK